MKTLRSGWVVASLLVLAACGGGGGGGGGGDGDVFGSWAIVSVTGGIPNDDDPVFDARSEWLRVESDDTFAVLNSTFPNDFHDVRLGVVTVTDTQVSFDGRLYNYEVSGSTLTLTRPDSVVVATRDFGAPTTDSWVVPVVELSSRVALAAAVEDGTDLAWDGSAFWVGNAYYGPNLQRIDTTTGAVTGTKPSSQFAWGMAWDGANFWVSSDGSDSLYQLDAVTGATIDTSPAMGSWLNGAAFDGTRLWAYSNNEQTLYSWTPGNLALDSTTETEDASAYNAGLEFTGGFLYLTDDTLIHKIQPAPFAVVRTYRYPALDLTGIGHDGTDFYLLGNANRGEGPAVWQIVRVSLP
jgi:hypothetical protein